MPTAERTAGVHRLGALVTVIVVATGLTVAGATPVHGGPRSAGRAPDVLIGDEVAPVAADLGEVGEAAATTVAEVPEAEVGDVGAGAPVAAPPDRDPLVQADALPAGAGLADAPGELSAPQQSFAGMTVPVSPPDTVGDVGPDHYVQMVNATSLQIWDKAGTSLVGPLSFASIWPAGDPCASNLGDPIVIYDQIADRWLLTQFARTSPAGPYFMCLALSQTADPTNGYWLYTFAVPAFPDYPKFGVWQDGYYMTSFEGTDLGVYVFDRVDMLVGAPANFLRTTIPALSPQAGVRSTRILPADVDGPVPPAGTGVPFVRTVDDTQDTADPTERIEIYEATVDFGAASLLFPLVDTLSPASFRVMSCDRNGEGVRDCIPQPDSDDTIDALSNRPMMSLKYRSVADGARMVFNQTVDVGAGLTGLPFAPTGEVAGIRWYQLHGGAGWSIGDQGTYAPQPAGITSEDQLIHRWMGSAAIDAAGNIAMAYSAVNSDSTDGNEIYPSLWYTGRQAGDGGGRMTQPEQTILAGTTPQGDDAAPVTPQRWGDYAAMSVDPVDECTFWFTGHNAGNPSRPTRIASFSFAACGLTGATCNGLAVTVDLNVGQVPTAGADVILGTPGADVIVALGGDDTICAQGGADTVNAGPGADWVDAGSGDDIVFGQDGDDTIGGGLGADQLLGFANNDTIDGGAGADVINGGPGNDTLNGGDQDDQIYGQGGNDTINAGPGADFVIGVDGLDVINGEAGNDTINGGPDADTVSGGPDNDTIYGLTGNDPQLNGDGGNDFIFGQVGNDTVNGGAGNDNLWGNEQNDIITDPSGTNVINAGPGDDNVTGGVNADTIYGDGNNAQGGNDTLNGGLGTDLVIGFAGNDTITANDGIPDTVNGGPGADTCTTDPPAIDTVYNCNP